MWWICKKYRILFTKLRISIRFSFAFSPSIWYNNSMFRLRSISVILSLLLVPFCTNAADEPGIIGSNLWLDFYSRIDDAWDALAQGITRRRLREKWNYGSLGCGASWLSGERIDQNALDQLRAGNTAILVQIANSKRVNLTTDPESSLRQCLVERYNTIQRSAYEDQNTLETVGNIWLYMDGDTANSDYDILSDITRINTIIFKEKYEYKWTKNATAQAVADMLVGKVVAPLFPTVVWSSLSGGSTPTSTTGGVGGSIWSAAGGTSSTLPWAGICSVGSTGNSGSSLFGDGFFDDIGSSLAGGNGGAGIAYTPVWPLGWWAIGSGSSTAFGLSEKADYYHQPSCDGIFCITINMVAGSQSGLGGFSNTSIESLLEQHSKMMDPISWSDLTQQKMTNNSYQLPWINIKFKNKIAWARVYMTESPQLKKNLKTEDTPQTKDAVFDAAYRCAMNEAWLAWDDILSSGFIGAGFVYHNWQTTTNIVRTAIPLWPKEMDSLAGCYATRIGIWQKEWYKSLSTDLNEIQAFTSAMMSIILEIIDTDRKLDRLPTK